MMIYTYGLYVKTYLQLDRKVVYIFMKMGRNRVLRYSVPLQRVGSYHSSRSSIED